MKNFFYILCVLMSMCFSASAQKISKSKIPAEVIFAFKTKFPDATKIRWEKESENEYEAEFKDAGKKMSANFDESGKWLETEIEIKIKDLPEMVLSVLKKDFKDYKIDEASLVQSLEYGECYEVELENGQEEFDVLYSTDGKLLFQEKVLQNEKEN